jgi:hypothetical protein
VPQALQDKTSAANPRRLLITSAVHAGINNLPKELSADIAAVMEPTQNKFDAIFGRDSRFSAPDLLAPWVTKEVRTQAWLTTITLAG